MEVEVTPKAADLVAVIALLSIEADSLRERVGQCGIRFHKRIFTREDIERGLSLCAKANTARSGSVEIRIES